MTFWILDFATGYVTISYMVEFTREKIPTLIIGLFTVFAISMVLWFGIGGFAGAKPSSSEAKTSLSVVVKLPNTIAPESQVVLFHRKKGESQFQKMDSPVLGRESVPFRIESTMVDGNYEVKAEVYSGTSRILESKTEAVTAPSTKTLSLTTAPTDPNTSGAVSGEVIVTGPVSPRGIVSVMVKSAADTGFYPVLTQPAQQKIIWSMIVAEGQTVDAKAVYSLDGATFESKPQPLTSNTFVSMPLFVTTKSGEDSIVSSQIVVEGTIEPTDELVVEARIESEKFGELARYKGVKPLEYAAIFPAKTGFPYTLRARLVRAGKTVRTSHEVETVAPSEPTLVVQ